MGGLTALQVKNAKPGRHADGRGLYLFVRDSGSRSWVLRTQADGKRRDIGLGSVRELSLAQARARASEVKAQILSGEYFRQRPELVPAPAPTFAEAARQCHEAIKGGWRNKHHQASWLASLERHIFPAFGSTPVNEITSLMVRDALAPIWLGIPETARRIFQRIRTVLDFAHIKGWCDQEVILRSVTRGLPRQPPCDNHFPAMPYAQIPALFSELRNLPQTAGRDALAFTVLTAARSGETRNALWTEFDLEARVWTVPASRMKMGKEHNVPLTAQAIEILLRRLPMRDHEGGFVFSSFGKRPISDMTMSKTLRDMGYPEFTVHGFRSTFTDWAAECTDYRKEVVDKALAHKLQDRIEAAYRRTDFFERRRKLMEDWSSYCQPAEKADDAGEAQLQFLMDGF
jgi:integrase